MNIDGFYDLLLEFILKMVNEGFLKEINQQMIIVSTDSEDLLLKMKNYVAPEVGKWIKKGNE